MYYLVTYCNYGKHKVSFENFKEIKKAVIEQLDGRGWDNKAEVDMRSASSCLHYLFNNVEFCRTSSYKKLTNFF